MSLTCGALTLTCWQPSSIQHSEYGGYRWEGEGQLLLQGAGCLNGQSAVDRLDVLPLAGYHHVCAGGECAWVGGWPKWPGVVLGPGLGMCGTPTLDRFTKAEHAIHKLQRVLGEDYQLLEVGLWHQEEVICQMLFCAGQLEYHVWEVLATVNELHKAQVRVINIIAEFHRGIPALDLEALHQVAMNSQDILQMFAECLEALLADLDFHPITPDPAPTPM